jgi:hypothetical protein
MNSLPQCIWRLHSPIQQIERNLSSKLDTLADISAPICMAASSAVCDAFAIGGFSGRMAAQGPDNDPDADKDHGYREDLSHRNDSPDQA